MKFLDMHVHTSSSPDAEIPAVELCRKGIKAGIQRIGFVAHVDMNPEDHCYNGFSEATYLDELDLAESSGCGVLRGLEVGEPHRYMEAAELLFSRDRYDFITGALHWTDGGLLLEEGPFKTGDSEELVEQYYRETLAIVQNCNINIVAHMGIFRRGMARAGLFTGLDEVKLFPELMKRILETMISRGIALEVNTAGLRRPENVTYPTSGVLSLYKALGGVRITLGSDTHKRVNIFFGLQAGYNLIKECGFNGCGVFTSGVYESYPLLNS